MIHRSFFPLLLLHIIPGLFGGGGDEKDPADPFTLYGNVYKKVRSPPHFPAFLAATFPDLPYGPLLNLHLSHIQNSGPYFPNSS
jgi:hypothetical protein